MRSSEVVAYAGSDARAYVKSVAMKYVRNETDAEDVT